MLPLAVAPDLRAETLEMGYLEEAGPEQGPGHFKDDYLRAAEIVLQKLDIPIHWVALPIRRMLHDIKQGVPNFCIGGVTITAERRELGQFSRPFRIDHMLALVSLRPAAPILQNSKSFAELVAHSETKFLAVRELNYGSAMETMLQQLGPRVSYSATNTDQLYTMLANGRAAFGIVTKTLGGRTLAERPDHDKFFLISYPDMRRDAPMGFLCSKAVSPQLMAKLNQAIARQLPTLRALFPDEVDSSLD
jgi:ABC-type amino acid transport substrate-binding protein